jgi:hypothetical protein
MNLAAIPLAVAALGAHHPAQHFSVPLDGKRLPITSTAWHPGAVTISATATRGEQELSLLRFKPGYSYARFLADGRRANGRGKAARAALARVMTRTDFAGGVNVFGGERASFSAVVRPGVYWLGEMNRRPLFRRIVVRGAAEGQLPAAAATVDEYDFGFRIGRHALPARGTITIRNTGRQPHRLSLEPVKPGTTRAEVGAYLRQTGGRPYAPPPSFARRGPELGTALLSPGQTIRFRYAVPRGTYALVGWQEDTKTGRPQALEGMYAVTRLR